MEKLVMLHSNAQNGTFSRENVPSKRKEGAFAPSPHSCKAEVGDLFVGDLDYITAVNELLKHCGYSL